MKILFLAPYPIGKSPSQRFRFEQYFSILTAAGHHFDVQSFLSDPGWDIIYRKGAAFKKLLSVISGFLRRAGMLFSIPSYDVIFIHREVAPIGPPIFEFIIAKIFRKKIVYDFDDAIWLTDKNTEGVMSRWLRARHKVAAICRWAHVVSCGNAYLHDYASQFNDHVIINPTTIDTSYHRPTTKQHSDKIVIGWTGTHSTLKYLAEVADALKLILQRNSNIQLLIISNDPGNAIIPGAVTIPWQKETEVEDLARIDIGIMPLPDDEWSKGKCGFKALQYMALEIPAVASPVGVNSTIIHHDVNGLLCSTSNEWVSEIERLIADSELRRKLGTAGRQTVEDRYSVSSNTSTFLALFARSAMITSASK